MSDLDGKVMYYLNHLDQLHDSVEVSKELLAQCIEHEPKNKYYLMIIGLILAWLGEKKNSIEWFERAAQFDYAEAMYVLGMIYEDEGNIEKAKAWYSESSYLGYSPGIIKLAIINKEDAEFFRELMTFAYTYAGDTKMRENAIKVYTELKNFNISQHESDLIAANKEFYLKSQVKHLEQQNALLIAENDSLKHPKKTFCERLGLMLRKSDGEVGYYPVRKKFENFPHF
ncbi:MAG: hypothetical protein Hyperionvirus7_41 [Hyperionvirus sp.]|uniref:Tetratricopeptide repeat protein n=1 Tax=Hyperionvirus sp. TaxID=2487770 RepID=A0A3G5A849_9VIRU|nr:MAG: hypothetical protein Hyperionvirus7_41 [Hyperionvirus sp.]